MIEIQNCQPQNQQLPLQIPIVTLIKLAQSIYSAKKEDKGNKNYLKEQRKIMNLHIKAQRKPMRLLKRKKPKSKCKTSKSTKLNSVNSLSFKILSFKFKNYPQIHYRKNYQQHKILPIPKKINFYNIFKPQTKKMKRDPVIGWNYQPSFN